MFDGIIKTFGLAALAGIILGLVAFGLLDATVPHDHCRTCGREVIHGENYCPQCGTPTDSVCRYNYWQSRKMKKQ